MRGLNVGVRMGFAHEPLAQERHTQRFQSVVLLFAVSVLLTVGVRGFYRRAID